MVEDVNDESLVQRAQTAAPGDLRAFEQLVLRHQSRVMANCRYMTGSDTDAQDLTQEVFVKVFFALGGFEGRSQFKSWVQRIKVNHCLNFLKKRRGKTFVDVDEVPEGASDALYQEPRAERRVEASDQRTRIRAVLDAMPDTLRIPLIMRDLDDMPYQEIADELQIGLSATKMRIKRARAEFRERFAELGTEPADR